MTNRMSFVVSGIALLALASTASAKTSDGLTPSVEQVCTVAGYTGSLWGLCNAYCEAMDCDTQPHHAADPGCENVRKNFFKASEGFNPPCDRDDGPGGGEDSGEW